jgi:PadR family transcriptional regulator PadR
MYQNKTDQIPGAKRHRVFAPLPVHKVAFVCAFHSGTRKFLAARNNIARSVFSRHAVGTNVPEAFEWTYVRAGDTVPALNAGRPQSFPVGTFPVLEFLVLSLLRHREMYGAEIANLLAERIDSDSPPGTGVIYPLLKNLRRDGFLVSYRTQGMARVYFRLTETGEARLAAVGRFWVDLNTAVQSIAITAPEDTRYLSQGKA